MASAGSPEAAQALLAYDHKAVDTLIVLSYLDMPETTDETIIDFLKRGPHMCSLRVCQPILEHKGRYSVLLELYRTRQHHEQALQLLQKLEVRLTCLVISAHERYAPRVGFMAASMA